MTKQRHFGQTIALYSAAFSALLMLPALAAFGWLLTTRGVVDTWTPSLLASVVFLGCCAGVLYVISRPRPVLAEGLLAPLDSGR